MKVITSHLWVSALIVFATAALALIVVSANTTISYSVADRGAVSLITLGGSGSPTIGYARIQPNSSNTTPAGLAIFGFRQNGILVSEAGVPAAPALRSGRIYAQVDGPVNTGLAMANPNNEAATVSFHFTNSSGVDFGAGTKTIAANSQFAAFLNEPPFNSGSGITGTFTFNSSVPVSVIALRGLTNERGEFLITTLPVTDTTLASAFGAVTFPHFADGGGWTTQVVLVNPGDNAISGLVQFFSQGSANEAGQPLSVTANGQTGTTFSYTIPRQSSFRLQTAGASATTSSGSIRVTPSVNQVTPSGLVIFSYKAGGFTVAEAGVPALRASTAFRLYAEASRPADSILTGVAVANPSSIPITVDFELTPLAGLPIQKGTTTIPANGQIAKFLNEIQGLSLSLPFRGVLRVSTSSPSGIAVIGLRSRVNERRDFLITTTPPVDETVPAGTAEAFFPHFVDNGGYTTQFILYSGSSAQQSSGQIRIFGQGGQPLDLSFAAVADLAVTQTTSPDSVGAGSILTYTITVTNNGPGGATGVQLTDVLPSGILFDSAVTARGSCPTPLAGVLMCDVGNLAAGANSVVTVKVRPSASGTLTNAVVVSGNEDDSAAANNRSVVDTVSGLSADLQISLSGPPTCNIGGGQSIPTGGSCDQVVYVIGVQNKGPTSASNVTVTDILPKDPVSNTPVTTRTAIVATQGITCSAVIVDRFTCNLGLMPAGASGTISTFVALDPTVIGRVVENRATVSSSDIVDTVPENDVAVVSMNVTPENPETDLQVVQLTASPVSVTRNNPLTVTAVVVNNGRSTASGVLVTTAFSGLAGAITVRSITPAQGACSLAGTSIVCSLGPLVRNSAKNISMVIVPSSAGQLTATATIAGNPSENDPQSGNNSQAVNVTVN